MENLRMILFAALAGILFLLYEAWQDDYARSPADRALAQQTEPTAEAGPMDEEVPVLGASSEASAPTQAEDAAPAVGQSGGRVQVSTDVFDLEIDLQGGDIRILELSRYPLTKQTPDVPVRLLNPEQPDFFVLQSGLIDSQAEAPDHRSLFVAERDNYRLGAEQNTVVVPLRWTGENGLSVEKIYHFQRGSYQVEVLFRITNAGDQARTLSPYMRMWRTPSELGGEPMFINSFMGVGAYLNDDGQYKFKKFSAGDLEDEKLSVEQQGGWLGMVQHHFLAAILPPANEVNRLNARLGSRFGFLAEYVGERVDVAPQASRELPVRLFIGPKLQQELDEFAPGLHLTVDYGLLTPIAEPLFWVLDKLHGLTGNWGWSIILLTLLIKAVFYKLSEAQYRSMARMKKFAPRIQSIKERYADDRERLHQAMMDLYKKEGFNPLAGCWPMLVQFPVFIALYWVLLESVELRQADFMFWLNDLSSPDPYYILPVLFGISMYLQQKLSGQAMTMEPMQQRIMTIMPIGLAIFFAFFPVGLVLYWFVSNVIGIAQQWVITRRIEAEDQRRKTH